MIAALSNKCVTVSTRYLIGAFVMCLISFVLVNLPAGLIGNALKNNGILYRDISGSIWNANMRSVNVASDQWSEVQLSLQKLPLLFGSRQIDFSGYSEDKKAYGILEVQEENRVTLRSFSATGPVGFRQNGLTLNSAVNLNSEQIELTSSGQCLAGEFTLTAELPSALFANFPFELPILEGRGECIDGSVSAFAKSANSDVDVSVGGEFGPQGNNMLLELTLPEALANNLNLSNLLAANGFQQVGSGWQASLEILQ